jgi:predicted RNase H-like HicB family nuclease
MAEEVGMQFLVSVDRDEDGVCIVECPAIPGCVTHGTTHEQALANVKDAIRDCLQVRAERGLPLTVETRQVEVVRPQPPEVVVAARLVSARRSIEYSKVIL